MDQPSDNAVEAARQALVAELGCAPEAINVRDVVSVEWNDSALGCPKPGMMYMQVITPGYRIVLEHGGHAYIFHTDRNRRFVRCEEDG